MTTQIDGRDYRVREYPIERLMFGTSWIGGVRAIRVTRQRQRARGPAREARTLHRYAERLWSRHFADDWERIGSPDVEFSDAHADLFIANRGAYKVTQRAVRRDADLERWLDGRPLAYNLRGQAIEIAVPVE